MYKLVAAVAVLALIAVPVSAEEAEDESDLLAIEGIYVQSDLTVWEESNDEDGLQTQASAIESKDFAADTQLL